MYIFINIYINKTHHRQCQQAQSHSTQQQWFFHDEDLDRIPSLTVLLSVPSFIHCQPVYMSTMSRSSFMAYNYVRDNWKQNFLFHQKFWIFLNYSYLLWKDHELICEDPDRSRPHGQSRSTNSKNTTKRTHKRFK